MELNNKGSLNDGIYMPMYLLLISITIILAGYIWFNISDALEPAINQTVDNTDILLSNIDLGFSTMDYMFPLIIGGLLIVSLIFAFKSGANIIYAILAFIFWIFALFLSAIFSNIFQTFINSFPSYSTQYPIIYFFMVNIKWIVLAWVFLISVVMFTRNKRDDDSAKFTQNMGAQYG